VSTTRATLDASIDGARAVAHWIESGDVEPWVEACASMREALDDPYGRSRAYGVFVAASVLDLDGDQQTLLRQATRPALQARLQSMREPEPIPDPEPMSLAGRQAAASYAATLTCGSAGDEFAPLPALMGLGAEALVMPSRLLADCFVAWDWGSPGVQAWGRDCQALLAEISALCATNSAAIEGWVATADDGVQDQPIDKVAATDVLSELRRQVGELTRRLEHVEHNGTG